MSKQHLVSMVDSLTKGDVEGAKAHFSNYSTEKSKEILSRGEVDEEDETPEVKPEGEVTPEEKPDGEVTPEVTDDGTKE